MSQTNRNILKIIELNKVVLNDNGEVVLTWNGEVHKGRLDTSGYIRARINIEGKRPDVPMSRLVWALYTGNLPTDGMHIDHIDRDRTNNHPSNLREVSPQINSINRVDPRGTDYRLIHLGVSGYRLQAGMKGYEYRPPHRKTMAEALKDLEHYLTNIAPDWYVAEYMRCSES